MVALWKPIWHLVIGVVLLLFGLVTGWNGLLEGDYTIAIALLMFAAGALNFGQCVQARRAGCGWREMPSPRSR